MIYSAKAIIAALIVGIFGLFLLWTGITGNIIKTCDGKAFLPRWMYILSGIVVLILPTAYIVVWFYVK